MAATHSPVDRQAVRERLRRVTDPELDRSIVDLEYVADLDVDGDRVRVDLVLPTAWCSPAFAWMMAADSRDVVAELEGVERVTVHLRDHMHGEEITRGVNANREFQVVFDDAEDDVAAVRDDLDHKARLARQYDAARALFDAGVAHEQAATLGRRDLDFDRLPERVAVYLADREFSVVADADPVTRYLAKARERGLVSSPADPLFRDADGDAIEPATFETVYRDTRLVRSNMEGQARHVRSSTSPGTACRRATAEPRIRRRSARSDRRKPSKNVSNTCISYSVKQCIRSAKEVPRSRRDV